LIGIREGNTGEAMPRNGPSSELPEEVKADEAGALDNGFS
jgi:hypothetical protein